MVIKAVIAPIKAPKATDPKVMVKNLRMVIRRAFGSDMSSCEREILEYSSMESQRTIATASFRRLSPKIRPFNVTSACKSYIEKKVF